MTKKSYKQSKRQLTNWKKKRKIFAMSVTNKDKQHLN